MPEPTRIHALATRLREEAERVQAVAARVAAVEGVPWRSPAGEAFRERAREVSAHVRRTARLLDDAAGTTDAHARAVARSRDQLAALAGRALSRTPGDR
jgi:uncharacterized protein YukE